MTTLSTSDLEAAASRELPKYKSHKEVWALKIKSIVRDGEGENRETDGSAMITPEEEGYAPFWVGSAYMSKHKPEVGGYYVVYKDGYQSFSPAQAFEEGNSLASRCEDQETVGPIDDKQSGKMSDSEKARWRLDCISRAISLKQHSGTSTEYSDVTALELAKKFEEYIFG